MDFWFLIWWDLFFLLVIVEKNQVGIFMNILKFQLDIPLVEMHSTMEQQAVLQALIVFPH